MTDPKQFTDVVYEVRDRAAWIIINRPKVYNAFRGQTLEELIQALHLAANDRQVASIVLTGAGDKAFCTGGDQSAHEGQYDGRGVVGLPIDELQGLIRDVPKPVIARVNGFAIGRSPPTPRYSGRSDRKSVPSMRAGARLCSHAMSETRGRAKSGSSMT